MSNTLLLYSGRILDNREDGNLLSENECWLLVLIILTHNCRMFQIKSEKHWEWNTRSAVKIELTGEGAETWCQDRTVWWGSIRHVDTYVRTEWMREGAWHILSRRSRRVKIEAWNTSGQDWWSDTLHYRIGTVRTGEGARDILSG